MTRIAIVGMACRYPEAASPTELWENAIAGRRAFRRLPSERMSLEDYWSPDPAAPDKFYARSAAVIEGYTFDRIGYKVAGSTYRSTDIAHWLALDTAARALADAGYPDGEGLPHERTSVVVGNTLTGDMTRASTMRLRWPYVRRTVAAALRDRGWDDSVLAPFLRDLEVTYKSPFARIDEDTLAGGLSNTIAGRICNHFDLNGGGYTVDGACSSSLLSVVTACGALVNNETDVAVAGGVDLSIDPFEIIGFAKTGALATGEMRVYDRGSNGFWPGEGCGMVVLMREDDARRTGHRIYASVAGWGISSDGKGGITRPEASGYRLALQRAYRRAGFGVDTVPMFEGHGTGTKVGDTTELTALSEARAAANPTHRAAISSVKSLIGHTKAAAGVAGLIKAAMAAHTEVLPPTIGCVEPHDVLTADDANLRALRKAEPWPADQPVRVGVTAMGFGGINTHIVLDKAEPEASGKLDARTRDLASSVQDVELLLIDASSASELRGRLEQLVEFVPGLAYAQLADLAATLHGDLRHLPFRAAAVVSSPDDAEHELRGLCAALDRGETSYFTASGRAALGHTDGAGRVGFLFPGQGSGLGTTGGALRRRFAEVEDVYLKAALPTTGDMVATSVAQPRIVTGSLAGLRALSMLGIDATVAVGHSLGEISALHWSGAMDEQTVLRIASVRGQTMAEHSASGTMAGIAASPEIVTELIAGLPVIIAAYNGPDQTVVCGEVGAVDDACQRAHEAGIEGRRLPVSHAFHSSLVEPAARVFGDCLDSETFGTLDRCIVSTVTGDTLGADTDIPGLLRRQITDPVMFSQALTIAVKDVDLFVEVGPGRVLTGLAESIVDVPVRAIDTDAESLSGLLGAVGAAYVIGAADVNDILFRGRLVKPLRIGTEFSFLTSPCETAPPMRWEQPAVTAPIETAPVETAPVETARFETAPAGTPLATGRSTSGSIVDMLRRVVATRAELPPDLVRDDSRLLDDLHLSSITVGQVVNQAAKELGMPPSPAPTNLATATLRELAESLEALGSAGSGDRGATVVGGVGPWAHPWRIDLDEVPLPARRGREANGTWRVYAESVHPFAVSLGRALERAGVASGVLVCLPDGCGEQHLALALEAAKTAAGLAAGGRLVLVQNGRGAAGIAKTLHLEAPHLRVSIVNLPDTAGAIDRVVAETASTMSFVEAHYDANGARRVPVLRALPAQPVRSEPALSASDVLLVTGGGKGITAECALAIAVDSGASLAVLGRSDPATDRELTANLARMAERGVTVRYARADVTDVDLVHAAVGELSGALGPITAVLHGAGRNEPASLASLTIDDFRRTFAPKVDGLRAVLAALEPGRLRLLISLGSIIGVTGLHGEAHYATANDWLAGLTGELAGEHPGCRGICLAWSVWSGVGMGERLDVVDTLHRDGVMPLTPDQGIRILRRVLADPDAPGVVVISGRTGTIDTVRYDEPALPLLRFVERPLVRYHGVELVTEVELNPGTDLYLDDHRLDDNLLMPAVLGMEGMAQVACALGGRTGTPTFEHVEFVRPIVVPPDGRTTIRIAALAADDGAVDVVIHSGETGFAADHFRARLTFADRGPLGGAPEPTCPGTPVVDLDPATDLYGDTMFQGHRFQRIQRYHRAAARYVDADVAHAPERWFTDFLPPDLILGDPGARDALMHGNQVCVPDATLLPVGIERLYPAGDRMAAADGLRYCAVERSNDGDTYVYDIALRTGSGEVIERWEGLRLRAVRRRDGRGPWVPALLGPYLERTVGALTGADVAVAVVPNPSGPGTPGRTDSVSHRRGQTAIAAAHALGRTVAVGYRPDGRPEVDGRHAIAAAHGAGVTLCVAAGSAGSAGAPPAALGCDVEVVVAKPESVWTGLLGPHLGLVRRITDATGESTDCAATRVWTAIECLQKAGQPVRCSLTFEPPERDGWTVFGLGDIRIATCVTTLRGLTGSVVFAVLSEGHRW